MNSPKNIVWTLVQGISPSLPDYQPFRRNEKCPRAIRSMPRLRPLRTTISMCCFAQKTYQKGIKRNLKKNSKQKILKNLKKILPQAGRPILRKTLNSIGECLVWLMNYKKGEKYIKEAFNMRITLLQ